MSAHIGSPVCVTCCPCVDNNHAGMTGTLTDFNLRMDQLLVEFGEGRACIATTVAEVRP